MDKNRLFKLELKCRQYQRDNGDGASIITSHILPYLKSVVLPTLKFKLLPYLQNKIVQFIKNIDYSQLKKIYIIFTLLKKIPFYKLQNGIIDLIIGIFKNFLKIFRIFIWIKRMLFNFPMFLLFLFIGLPFILRSMNLIEFVTPKFISDFNGSEYIQHLNIDFNISTDWFLGDNEELILYFHDENISEMSKIFNKTFTFKIIKNRDIIEKEIKDIEDIEEDIDFDRYILLEYKQNMTAQEKEANGKIVFLDDYDSAPEEDIIYIPVFKNVKFIKDNWRIEKKLIDSEENIILYKLFDKNNSLAVVESIEEKKNILRDFLSKKIIREDLNRTVIHIKDNLTFSDIKELIKENLEDKNNSKKNWDEFYLFDSNSSDKLESVKELIYIKPVILEESVHLMKIYDENPTKIVMVNENLAEESIPKNELESAILIPNIKEIEIKKINENLILDENKKEPLTLEDIDGLDISKILFVEKKELKEKNITLPNILELNSSNIQFAEKKEIEIEKNLTLPNIMEIEIKKINENLILDENKKEPLTLEDIDGLDISKILFVEKKELKEKNITLPNILELNSSNIQFAEKKEIEIEKNLTLPNIMELDVSNINSNKQDKNNFNIFESWGDFLLFGNEEKNETITFSEKKEVEIEKNNVEKIPIFEVPEINISITKSNSDYDGEFGKIMFITPELLILPKKVEKKAEKKNQIKSEKVTEKKVIEELAKKNTIEELAKKNAIEEIAKKNVIEELAKKNAIEELAKKKVIEELAKKNAIEEIAKKKIIEELAKKNAIEEIAKKKAIEELAKKKTVEELAKKKAIEELAKKPIKRYMPENKVPPAKNVTVEKAKPRLESKVENRYNTIFLEPVINLKR